MVSSRGRAWESSRRRHLHVSVARHFAAAGGHTGLLQWLLDILRDLAEEDADLVWSDK